MARDEEDSEVGRDEGSEERRQPQIKSGRVGRTAGVGGLVAGQGLRWAGTRLANLTRGEQARQRRTDERVASIATQLARQLGEMKGAAMKIGQVLSTVELPGLSEEGQAEFRAALAELRDNAPSFEFDDIRAVVEEDLGAPIGSSFAEFEPEAFAAASIGQVHRAVTHEGERVAVKVQYPGVAEAVEIDLRNLHLILRLVKRMAPGLDARAVGGEIRERIIEELDYELEAQTQREIARAYRGHPFAVVPGVLTALSGRRVLTTNLLEGARFEQVRELPEAERDRYGECLFRFFFSMPMRIGLALGDPHPGNYLLLDDGRVGFLDFGLARRIPAEYLELERCLAEAVAASDPARVHELMTILGYLPEPEDFDGEQLLAQIRAGAGWLFEPGFRRLDPDHARELLEYGGGPRSPHFEAMKRQTVPPASLLMRRQEGLILVVLADLRAGAEWGAIAREYFAGDRPTTPLGEADAAFWAARP